LGEVGVLEGMPKMEGKRMLVIFAPKPVTKKVEHLHNLDRAVWKACCTIFYCIYLKFNVALAKNKTRRQWRVLYNKAVSVL
ncbi:MAG: hypothetical protein ACTHLB_11590, partial [Parafilimonas sp.]